MREIAIFGDSIANGLGVRGTRYCQLVADAAGLELIDFSGTAQTATGSLELLRSASARPDFAIVAHGITEAILRPRPEMLRFLPSRWRKTGWMDPRPYYSTSWRRRVPERIESEVRWRLKNLLMRLGGTSQIESVQEYRLSMRQLVSELQSRGTQVLVLGSPDIGERFFPGSQTQQSIYESVSCDLDAQFVSLEGKLHKWDDYLDDRFHPNDSGHQQMANVLLENLSELHK